MRPCIYLRFNMSGGKLPSSGWLPGARAMRTPSSTSATKFPVMNSKPLNAIPTDSVALI
jgi:hypothetical protein